MGLKFHKLFIKPSFDVYVDDKNFEFKGWEVSLKKFLKLKMKKNLKIGNRLIGDKFKTFIIASSQAHNGKISKVFKYIDAVSTTGAHAIKFQTIIAEEESILTNHLEKDLILKLKTD